jgi:ABC-type sugar transport system permease subunit
MRVSSQHGSALPALLRTRRPRRNEIPNGLLIPIILVGLGLGIYPIASAVVLGFTNERVGGIFGNVKTQFVGFENLVGLFSDPTFLSGLRIILVLSLVIVVTTYVLAYLQALLLNQDFPLRRVARIIALLPLAIAPVVIGQMFRYIYDPSVGSVNGILLRLRLEHAATFLPTSNWGLVWLALPAVWLGLPFATIFLLASIQGVSQELVDAAMVDGAGPWKRFWVIVFPETRGALAAVVPLSFAAQVAAFDIYFTMLGGLSGTASANLFIPSVYSYFSLSNGLMGKAAATVDVILVISLVFFLVSRLIHAREER